jgi:hypothetical protein
MPLRKPSSDRQWGASSRAVVTRDAAGRSVGALADA